MGDIKPFSWTGAVAKVTEAFQAGPQFRNPNLSPAMTITDGTAPGIDEKLMVQDAPTESIIDSWNERRAK